MRIDRGGEFTSNKFVEFCTNQGISRQLIAAYTPQQNRVAERKNRTIMNMVRSMLIEKLVPKMFWPEICSIIGAYFMKTLVLKFQLKISVKTSSETRGFLSLIFLVFLFTLL